MPDLSISSSSSFVQREEQQFETINRSLMESEQRESSNGLNFDGDAVVVNGEDHHYDEVDSGIGRVRNGSGYGIEGRVVSGSTQTDDFEFDVVDGIISGGVAGRRFPFQGWLSNNNGSSGSDDCIKEDAGLLSNIFTMVLPRKRKFEHEESVDEVENFRCVSTQTEESPVSVRGHELSCLVIQELALKNHVQLEKRDEVLDALCCCICEILDKHNILFSGMVRRFEVTEYRAFYCIANELFEASSPTSEMKITWGRIVSLFAFAVKVAQKFKQENEEDKLDNVIQYLSNYISKHLLDFIESDGGWEGLVKQFPPPGVEGKQVNRAMMWSGLCVGLVATMCVSSFLSK